jgi:hypothetical protein
MLIDCVEDGFRYRQAHSLPLVCVMYVMLQQKVFGAPVPLKFKYCTSVKLVVSSAVVPVRACFEEGIIECICYGCGMLCIKSSSVFNTSTAKS